MSAAAGISRTWSVGRYTVTMTLPREGRGMVAACVEWEPHMPARLSADELQQYRAGRADAITEMAAELRINVAVVDL